MSDLSGLEIHDVLGLSEPLTKLLEVISKGVGKIYEPIHIKRLAKAHKSEINTIGEAMEAMGGLPIKYETGSLSIDASDSTDIFERMKIRSAFQDFKKQRNIDKVVGYAAEDLSSIEKVSSETIDDDWITKFFNCAENISTEEMQFVWGKILAGEIKAPGSFSLRALDTIKNISKTEAQLFSQIAPYVISFSSGKYITSNDKLLEKYGITYGTVLTLDECGVLNSNSSTRLVKKIKRDNRAYMYNNKAIAFFDGEEGTQIEYSIYKLTNVGSEIYEILDVESNDDCLADVAVDIVNSNHNNVNIPIHKIEKIEHGEITYSEEPLNTINP